MKYLVTRTDDEGNVISMTFEYGQEGFMFLKRWTIEGNWPDAFWRNIWKNPPYTPQVLLKWDYPGTEIKEVPEDLSFIIFWEQFKYKVGDKKKAEKLWNLMNDGDRIAALAGIPKYLFWLATKQNMEQTHATTWLKQRRWENDYKK
jgi:hypothetical protein